MKRPDALAVVQLHVAALFTHDESGDLVHVNEPAGAPAPRFYVGTTAQGLVRCFRYDVDAGLRRRLEAACDDLPQARPLDAAPDLARYAELLAQSAPVQRTWAGPVFSFPERLPRSRGTVRVTEQNAGLLRQLLPEWIPDVQLSQPLLAIAVEGHAVAVCGSVRRTTRAHEAGTETATPFRGRGYAAQVTAAWAFAVRETGCVPLYSTSWQNLASRAVAKKLACAASAVISTSRELRHDQSAGGSDGRKRCVAYSGGGMRLRTLSLTCAVLLVATACMPQERINRSCQWTNDPVQIGPPRSRERRDHLEEDVRVAQDLGIRYGDSVAGRIWNDANRDAREWCTSTSLQQIMRQHRVSRGELDAVTGARELWLDLLLVFVPMSLVFVAGSRIFVRHVAGDYEPADRLMVLLILGFLTPVMAFIGAGVAQIWAVLVEEYRLRSDHISYRAAYLPLYVYKEVAWAVAAVLFVAVAAAVTRHASSRRDPRALQPNSSGLPAA